MNFLKSVVFPENTHLPAVNSKVKISVDMDRTRENCPVVGCRSNNLAKLSNHLAQVHIMNIEKRAKWLKWAKLETCVPIYCGNGTDHELNMKKKHCNSY